MGYDIVIIGGGPAGLTAALYARRAGLSPIVLEQTVYGGQVANTPEVENYPGIPSISGVDLAMALYDQVAALGVEVRLEAPTGFRLEGGTKEILTAKGSYTAGAVIIANGAKRRKLSCPGEDRLAGRGVALSRQGGGGGGGGGARRGAGESKKELDRRHIQRRITTLTGQLAELAQRRQRLRARRKKDRVTTVAIVGYTNVGKSTLLNTLTRAGVLAEDKLFATLDPTARALSLPDGRQVMLIDTVGLVRRLPHHLVEAFRSTLEEAAQADLILNVCDASGGEMAQQLAVTRELLAQLGAEDVPVLTVLNKCDLLPGLPEGLEGQCVAISARTGAGIGELLAAIAKALPPAHLRARLLLPYRAGELEARIAADGRVFRREYTPEGTLMEANVPVALLPQVKEYILSSGGDPEGPEG